ncbi:MAG: hypothetical protein U9N54_04175 [candidate division Zixibacteria bacterium]|nr:hypothetical protein [candidate division Zixibacteria bacterium]
MKYFMILLVFVLLLIPASNTTAKVNPDSYLDLTKPGGDDHPWGGEEVAPILPNKSIGTNYDPIFTGIPLIDIFLNNYLGSYYPRTKISAPSIREVDNINLYQPTVVNQTNQSDIFEGNNK